MGKYAARRALINIPVILIIITVVFVATNVLPEGFVARQVASNFPVGGTEEDFEAQIAAVEAELGIDKPLHERYVDYMFGILQGDFGESFRTREPAVQVFMNGIPYTAQLGVMTIIFAAITSLPVGVLSAMRQDAWPDYVLRFIAILAVAAPGFWIATMLQVGVVRAGLWDLNLIEQPLLWEKPVESLKLFILPAVSGGLVAGGGIMRLLRSQMLEVLRQDYVRTAWAKGSRERVVVIRHAMKNAMIPVITALGLTMATLIGGNVVYEFLFNIPGVGSRILTAINDRDVPVVQSFILFIATFVVFVNLAIDLLYGWFNPRIRYS